MTTQVSTTTASTAPVGQNDQDTIGESLLNLAQQTDSIASGTILSPQHSQYVAGRDLTLSDCKNINIGDIKPKSNLVDYVVPILTVAGIVVGSIALCRNGFSITATITKG